MRSVSGEDSSTVPVGEAYNLDCLCWLLRPAATMSDK